MINRLLMILFTIHAGYSMKGGFHTALGEVNYVALILQPNIPYSSGVIVHENHIITVAHRIALSTVADLRVLVGKNMMVPQYTVQYPVKNVYFHPDFERPNLMGDWNNEFYEHDIAVLRLEHSLIWSLSVSKVPLPDIEFEWNYHLQCILISWNLSDDRREPMILSWQWMKLVGREVHRKWNTYLREDQQFFNDYLGTAAIGAEDLGSPLVCGDVMTGLVIKGEQRQIPSKPSIVMSIAPYLGFIDEIIHDGVFEVQSGEFPYIAAVWYNDIHVCGGFIVNTIHVVTVGHCLVGYETGNFTVSVGHPSQWFSLTDIVIHPNYRVGTTEAPPYWYIDHDFALLTLAKPIVWNQKTSPLPLEESDDFYVGQLCEVLRWKHQRDEASGTKFIELMTSHVTILYNECSQPQLDPSPQFQVPSFWGKSQYLMPMADYTDVGNPIICDGKPVGFLIQAIPSDGKTTAVLARFLKIRPYIEPRNCT